MWEVDCQPYIIATYSTGSFFYWRCATNSCEGLILNIHLFVAGWYHECDKSIAEANVLLFTNIINCTVIHYMKDDVLSLFDIESWMPDTLLMDK